MTLEALRIASFILYTFFKKLRTSFRHTSDTPWLNLCNLSLLHREFEATLNGGNQ